MITGMPDYAILMRENDDAWSRLAPAEQQALMQRYEAWTADLKARGIFQGGLPLGAGGRVLSNVDGTIVEAPFAETRQVLTGYIVIAAPDWDAAVAIARGCPALTHGETVELRPVGL